MNLKKREKRKQFKSRKQIYHKGKQALKFINFKQRE